MSARSAGLLLCLSIAACTAAPRSDTAQLPPGVYGVYRDNDTGAIDHSAWAFASPLRTLNDPVDAAKAVIAVDYLAGELIVSPRWVMMSPLTKQQMLQARADVRHVLGIEPNAPTQLVVNALLQVAAGLQLGDQSLVARGLETPIFAQPPQQTLQILANLPYIQSANIATSQAANQILSHGDQNRT